MKLPESRTGWFRVAIGLFLLCGAFYKPAENNLTESDLTGLTVIAYQDIQPVGSKSSFSYKVWSKEYSALFLFRNSGKKEASKQLENVKKNDTLFVKIASINLKNLHSKTARIPVYAIAKNGVQIYDLQEYKEAKQLRNRRIKTISGLMGAMLLLGSFSVFSSRTRFVVGGLAFGLLLVLLLLGIW